MEKELFVSYKVRFDFVTWLAASVPGNSNLTEIWLKNRQPRVKPPGGRSIDEINEEVFASLPEENKEEEIKPLIFQRANWNGGNLVIRAATLRAHMKDCARVISTYYTGKIEGEKSFAVKVKNCVWLPNSDYWIPILRADGSKIIEADGIHEKPIHVIDQRGRPMNALKLFEYVDGARLDFQIDVLGGCVPLQDLQTLFRFGGVHGYAGERSDGLGKYTFEVEPIVEEKEVKKDGRDKKGSNKLANSGRSEQRA